ncbi:MAG: MauE/DoxX family redox-associated membrane protein [Syntrophaceae bacterium]
MSDKTEMTSRIALVFRICIGVLFLYAGIIKTGDPAGFAVAIGNYQILPQWAVNPAAIVLPLLEILLGITLILGFWIEGGSLFATVLFAVFSFALAFNLIRGLDINCGCFSASPKKISWLYFLRDLGLMSMSIFVFFFDTYLCSLTNWAMAMAEKKGRL